MRADRGEMCVAPYCLQPRCSRRLGKQAPPLAARVFPRQIVHGTTGPCTDFLTAKSSCHRRWQELGAAFEAVQVGAPGRLIGTDLGAAFEGGDAADFESGMDGIPFRRGIRRLFCSATRALRKQASPPPFQEADVLIGNQGGWVSTDASRSCG